MKILIFLFLLPISLYTNTSEKEKMTLESRTEKLLGLKDKKRKKEAKLLAEFATITENNIKERKEEYLNLTKENTFLTKSGIVNHAKYNLKSNLSQLRRISNEMNLNSEKNIKKTKVQIEYCNDLLEKFIGYLRAFDENYRKVTRDNDHHAFIKKSIEIIGKADIKIASAERKFYEQNQNNLNEKHSI
ncbi:MAG: hypothetical protein ACXWL5_00980 [Candidatus Chromulinivorax sp.]